MGIWVGKPELAESETVRWQCPANRTQSARRAVGGRLHLTGARLVFEPNRMDAVTGGARWSAPLASVRAVGVQRPDGSAFSGGLRSRLRIDLDGGAVKLFVVSHLDDVVQTLGQAAARRF